MFNWIYEFFIVLLFLLLPAFLFADVVYPFYDEQFTTDIQGPSASHSAFSFNVLRPLQFYKSVSDDGMMQVSGLPSGSVSDFTMDQAPNESQYYYVRRMVGFQGLNVGSQYTFSSIYYQSSSIYATAPNGHSFGVYIYNGSSEEISCIIECTLEGNYNGSWFSMTVPLAYDTVMDETSGQP